MCNCAIANKGLRVGVYPAPKPSGFDTPGPNPLGARGLGASRALVRKVGKTAWNAARPAFRVNTLHTLRCGGGRNRPRPACCPACFRHGASDGAHGMWACGGAEHAFPSRWPPPGGSVMRTADAACGRARATNRHASGAARNRALRRLHAERFRARGTRRARLSVALGLQQSGDANPLRSCGPHVRQAGRAAGAAGTRHRVVMVPRIARVRACGTRGARACRRRCWRSHPPIPSSSSCLRRNSGPPPYNSLVIPR